MESRRMVLGCTICAILGAGVARAAGRGPARPGGVIDVHAHVQVADYIAFAAKAGLRRPVFGPAPSRPKPGGPPPASPGNDDEAGTALRLKIMDEAGVGMQMLSPTLAPYFADEATGAQAARILNDGQARLAKAHPSRLGSFVSLPLPHVDASLAEMRRGLDELGMNGVTMQCSCLGRSIADAAFDPLFREMNARKAVLFLHPAVNGLASPLLTDWGLTPSVGPLMEDTTVALQLMVSGIPVRYPDIRIIVPHLGGGLAGMIERMDNQMSLFKPDLMGKPSQMARSFWYDTVSHGSRIALRAAADAFGADRLVPGSDFPVLLPFEPYADTFGYVQNAGLAKRDADAILYDNAKRLLRL